MLLGHRKVARELLRAPQGPCTLVTHSDLCTFPRPAALTESASLLLSCPVLLYRRVLSQLLAAVGDWQGAVRWRAARGGPLHWRPGCCLCSCAHTDHSTTSHGHNRDESNACGAPQGCARACAGPARSLGPGHALLPVCSPLPCCTHLKLILSFCAAPLSFIVDLTLQSSSAVLDLLCAAGVPCHALGSPWPRGALHPRNGSLKGYVQVQK